MDSQDEKELRLYEEKSETLLNHYFERFQRTQAEVLEALSQPWLSSQFEVDQSEYQSLQGSVDEEHLLCLCGIDGGEERFFHLPKKKTSESRYLSLVVPLCNSATRAIQAFRIASDANLPAMIVFLLFEAGKDCGEEHFLFSDYLMRTTRSKGGRPEKLPISKYKEWLAKAYEELKHSDKICKSIANRFFNEFGESVCEKTVLSGLRACKLVEDT